MRAGMNGTRSAQGGTNVRSLPTWQMIIHLRGITMLQQLPKKALLGAMKETDLSREEEAEK